MCQRLGSLLVLLQFGLLACLSVLAAAAWSRGTAALASGLLAAASVLLGGWALWHNRLGNFNIHPAPKPEGVLVMRGPYRLMRHPMYSAVLLAAAALASRAGGELGWLLWTGLFGVLLIKARLEESWLRQHHPAYANYCKSCKRFVPWVF